MSYKFNPFTNNFDISQDTENFSINEVREPLEIPDNQQMILRGELSIKEELKILGQIIVKEVSELFPRDISEGELFICRKPALLPSVTIKGIGRIKSELLIRKTFDAFTLVNPVKGLFRIRKDRYYFTKRISVGGSLKIHGTLNIGA
jgi:hypothetical protein